MHLLLMIPSSLLLVMMFLHSWRYRGRGVTIAFFGLCFGFGLLRGNTIYWIITTFLSGDTLPYLFLRPAIRLWNASMQECIGWIFALYLCWSTAEWVLGRRGQDKIGLYRLIGLAGFLMGSVAYAIEAAAAAAQWWVWVFPVKNPFFVETPFVGIVAWISVSVDFLAVFLLIRHRAARGWWALALLLLFPLHMWTHFKLGNLAVWLPFSPNEIWHFVMIALLVWGIAVDGPQVTPWTVAAASDSSRGSWRKWGVHVALTGFLLVLALVHFALTGRPAEAISMAPFVIGVLFFRPPLAAGFLALSSLVYLLTGGEWTYLIAPSIVFAVFAFGSGPVQLRLPLARRREIALAAIGLGLAWNYYLYHERFFRYNEFQELGKELGQAESLAEVDSLLGEFPSPLRPEDAFHYNLLGARLNQAHRFSSARKVLLKAVECDITYAYAYFNLGWCYRNLDNLAASLRNYERGLELNPIDFNSILILGEMYQEQDRLDDAEELYRRTLTFRPDRTEIILALESVLYASGRVEEAIELLKNRLPDNAEARKIEGRLAADLFKAGRSDEAVEHYKRVITENVEQLYGASLSLALIYWRDRQQPERALDFVSVANRVKPTVDTYSLMGRLLEELGRNEQARRAYRMADSLAAGH
ncbi:MAG: tetratricopeptide repeat protein [Candidatus Glassbacteria bacterium]|nr:tetratricopeptide repeat protein [Candidatus Glassbacteria bacterium]